jgi:hypothetical protein
MIYFGEDFIIKLIINRLPKMNLFNRNRNRNLKIFKTITDLFYIPITLSQANLECYYRYTFSPFNSKTILINNSIFSLCFVKVRN